jgi:uncharacterized protein
VDDSGSYIGRNRYLEAPPWNSSQGGMEAESRAPGSNERHTILEDFGGIRMNTGKKDEEVLISERNFDSIFSYTAGKTRSKFLTELRDNKKIMGIRCPNCELVWVPPRTTCVKCFASLNDFIEVGKAGVLKTYSSVNSFQPFYPAKPPFIVGIIQLDGADNGLVHLLGDVEAKDLKTGLRVEAVFKHERTGSILDIQYFKPTAIKRS